MNTERPSPFSQTLITVTLLSALLSACATTPREKPGTLDSIEQSLTSKAKAPIPEIPPEVSAALVAPSVPLTAPLKTLPEPRFDIALKDMEARDFFMGLVEGTPYNIIVHPEVAGTLSLDLKNVTVDDVMQAVRDVYGYEYRKKGSVYQVLPARMRSRIYKVNYLNIHRTGKSSMKVSSGQVSNTTSSSSTEDTSSDSTETASTTSESVSGSEVSTRSDADFWTELKDALTSLIGDENGRRVVVNPQAGVVVVRAMPGELRDVEDYLATIQNIIERQVILEAKVIEVQLNDGFQSGINWMALGEPANGETIQIGQIGGGTLLKNGVSSLAGGTVDLSPGVAQNGLTSSSFGGMFTLGISANDFTALIELLKTQGDVQVLSSPRVATVNNQKAVIKVGEDEFFVTDIQTESTTTTNVINRNVDVELTPFFSGVALDVIPQIDGEGDVTLHIHPTVSEVKEKNKEIAVSTTESLSIPLALSSIRESDAIIRAKSGQIVVIGGLMKDQLVNNTAKTPFLGDLPGIGPAFQHRQKVSRKSELVILLRPIVTDGANSWHDAMRDSLGRVHTLTR